MNRVQIQLDDAQVAAVRRLSHERGVSVAAVVRDAVDQFVADEPATGARERALAHIGGFHSGHHDISKRHDDHLAGVYG